MFAGICTHAFTMMKELLCPVLLICAIFVSDAFIPLIRVVDQKNSVNAEKNKGSDGEKNERKKQGYQFGDVTRFLAKQSTQRVKKLTGRDVYQFGDISRWLDRQTKNRISSLTGKEEGDYEFGDLTRWADAIAKEKVANFTGKKDYQIGDMSKEIVRRVRSGEYELSDVFLALRVLLATGASLTPITSVLPIRVLLDLVNLGLAQDVTGKLVGVLASNLDERMKQALTGDVNYQLGDVTKTKLRQALMDFTGKKTYEFGDLSRTIGKLIESNSAGVVVDKERLELKDQVASALDDWDRRFQKQKTDASKS
jgi:hypothetical protein